MVQIYKEDPVKDMGTQYALIYSPFGNQCPFKLESGFWLYHDGINGHYGWKVAAANEINVICLKE